MRSQLKNKRGKMFKPQQELNHGSLESKASVQAMNYTDTLIIS